MTAQPQTPGAGSTWPLENESQPWLASRERNVPREPGGGFRGYRMGEVPPRELPLPGKRCRRCRLWYAAAGFRPNKTLRDGLHSYCRRCESEYRKAWRASNPARMAVYNAERRRGPLDLHCVDCREVFQARSRLQTRCKGCQAEHVRTRPR
jgi:hypothetical protein